MSEDRETPAETPAAHEEPTVDQADAAYSASAGSPVEESEATTTEIREAVDRAGGLGPDQAEAPSTETPANPAAPQSARVVPEAPPEQRPQIAEPDELPSAGPSTPAPAGAPAGATTNTEGNIVISPDHPMAALYLQTPSAPELRGNRGAGVLIGVLATIAFALVYAGVLALALAPSTPPSRFLDSLVTAALWPTVVASVAFLIGIIVLVLIVGRAGWWAYVLGGFLVGVLTWLGALAGLVYAAYVTVGTSGLREMLGGDVGSGLNPFDLLATFGLMLPAIAAGVVAREATVWFGAWIGARGRKVTRRNSELLAEYERSLAEAQAKQP